MIDYSNQGVVWYAMKTTYKREMQAKSYLESRGVECFVPMEQSLSTRAGRKVVIQRPAIHNLIFVKSDLAQLMDLKSGLNYLHNRLIKEGELLVPIVVPTHQMEQFIDLTTHHIEEMHYVDLEESRLEKGTPVRVIEGRFKGCEGELERIKGKRARRVWVNIKGIVAYTFEVEAKAIEIIG